MILIIIILNGKYNNKHLTNARKFTFLHKILYKRNKLFNYLDATFSTYYYLLQHFILICFILKKSFSKWYLCKIRLKPVYNFEF